MKILYMFLLLLLVVSVNAGTNSVNLVLDGDLERSGKVYWSVYSTETEINHSPVKAFTFGGATYYKVFTSVKHAIDSSKEYDFSFWYATSNYTYTATGEGTPLSVVLYFYRNYDDSENFAAESCFSGGGDNGFDSSWNFTNMVYVEKEKIVIPDEANYFLVRINFNKNTQGRAWLDDFYLGEVKKPGSIIIIQ